jgi:preprotein translocase subunit SecD
VRDADQLIADALRDIAAEAGLPRPAAVAAWRAGRRRRLARLSASAAALGVVIALALTIALPLTAAPGPASSPRLTGRLVSLTLSPARPASPGVLADTARLLRERAAHLHLPDTQARVSGPDVVLTGPAADQARLETLAAPGVLNFRQELLYQPYRATRHGDASLVNHTTLALFSKLVCAPDNAGTWKTRVGYTAADDYDNPSTQIVACDSIGGKYALDVAKVPGTQISSAVAGPSATSNPWEVTVTLKRAGATAFASLTSDLAAKYLAYNRTNNLDDYTLASLAVVLDGNVISAPLVIGQISAGTAMIPGNFTRAQAEELAAQLQSGPLPADFEVSAQH